MNVPRSSPASSGGSGDALLARRFPDHLASGYRIGDALQRQWLKSSICEPASRADERPHDLRGEDLAGVRRRPQSRLAITTGVPK